MQFICQNKNIQLLRLPISEMNCSNSTKWTVKLAKLDFYGMNIFHHQFDDINVLMRIPADKEFSCGF